MVVYDAAGRIVRLSPAAEKLLAYQPAERELSLVERTAVIKPGPAEGKPLSAEETLAGRAVRGETVTGMVMRCHRRDRAFGLIDKEEGKKVAGVRVELKTKVYEAPVHHDLGDSLDSV